MKPSTRAHSGHHMRMWHRRRYGCHRLVKTGIQGSSPLMNENRVLDSDSFCHCVTLMATPNARDLIMCVLSPTGSNESIDKTRSYGSFASFQISWNCTHDYREPQPVVVHVPEYTLRHIFPLSGRLVLPAVSGVTSHLLKFIARFGNFRHNDGNFAFFRSYCTTEKCASISSWDQFLVQGKNHL